MQYIRKWPSSVYLVKRKPVFDNQNRIRYYSSVCSKMSKGTLCVTGAGGFQASWVVKLLLSKGYKVHGTVRDPTDVAKNGHLLNLDNAAENLKLFKADLLDYEGLRSAIHGCDGVLHVASPIPPTNPPDPEAEIVEPAVKGVINVLKACLEEKIKKVVYVSSGAAIFMNPNWPKGQVKDESCWSDPELCRASKNWYFVSKTLAEREGADFAEKHGINLVRVCPMIIWGPVLQHTANTSSLLLLKLVKEGVEKMDNRLWLIVDARDVAEALLLVYEKPEAEGRYICSSHEARAQECVELLKKHYPNYNYPKSFSEPKEGDKLTSEKLQKLGWSYRSLEDTLVDSVESYKKVGHLE